MEDIKLEQISIAIKDKRGNRGLREVAQEIGISHATLSRIEGGKQPDLETFSKICNWLNINPAKVLNYQENSHSNSPPSKFKHTIAVQFRANKDLSPETANKLGEMIILVQKMINDEHFA